MAEMLRAPTEGCAEAIIVPHILAEQFKLKHSLINMMTSKQFFGLEKDNPHDHVRAARRWLEKEPSRSITTWDDLVSKFINEFFPPSRTTNLRNEISNFQQKFDESFHEAWERYKDLLHAYQDSLNAAAGDNLLEKSPQDALTIIENKSKVCNSRSPVNACDNHSSSELAKLTHAVNQQTSVVTTAMTAMLKQFQSNPPPAQVKAVEEIYVTCGGSHPYYQCLAAGGNTFPEYRDNIQGYVSAATGNYNQGNPGLPDLIPTRMTLELANRAICTPNGIARDVFVLVGKFTFLADFVIVDYESDPRVPFILGRPFLRTARALIDVYGEEMILRDGDERLTLNMKHDTASYSNHPYRDSVNLINIFNLSSEDCLEDLVSNKKSGNPTFSLHKEIASLEVIHKIHDSKGCTFLFEELPDIDSFNDIHPYFHDDPLSGSPTYSAHSLLEEEIEFLLYQGEDSDFKDLTDQSILTNYDDLFVDPTPEMFTDEQPPAYSFPPRFDVYPDDFLEIESDATFDDDSFDYEGEKIKEAELLIDPLDLPCDILSEYDSFHSQDFSRDDVLPSPDNEDKVFNPGILFLEKSVLIIIRVAQEKKLTVSYASWLSEDFDPPFYELFVFKEVPNSMRLLPFSSENEEKVFKPGIYTFKKFHCCFLPELSHLGRPFLRTARALIDVHGEEMILRDGDESGNPTFSLHKEIASPEVILEIHDSKGCTFLSEELPDIDSFNDIHPYFDDDPLSGSPTPSDDQIVSTTSPQLTLFRDSDFLLFEDVDAFLGLEDDPDLPELDPSYYDPEGDILLLEAILNSDPSHPLPNHDKSMPSFKDELKACKAKTIKSSIDEPPEVELKDLPPHLEYAFLEGNNKLPVIIAKALKDEEKSALIKVLKSHKRAIAWKLSDIQDTSECFEQILDFLNASVINYALTVNPTIYVSCIKQFWSSVSVKKVNDMIRLQALIDRKKCMSAKRTAWNEFSSSIASAVIYLAIGRKFSFSKYIFDNLIRNVDSSSKFYMYPRFLQLMIATQVGDLTSHTTKYSSPTLTQKVFANMRRVGTGFSMVNIPLYEGMLVPQQAADDVDDVVAENVPTDDVADVVVDDVIADDVTDVVAHATAEPTPPSPIPTTTPPPPSQELPSTSQIAPTPSLSPHQSPQQ
nr:hypothetical protein [Tanacetum cinerariifolium]